MSVCSDDSDVEETVSDCEELPAQIDTTAQRLSAFVEYDLVIKIENTKVYVNQEQLMTESSVFKEKLASLSKDLPQKEIELADENVKTFVDFLRCTLPGFDEHMTDDIVHEMLPLAKKYAATKTLDKADNFLTSKCRIMGSQISSDQIVKNILQAELYNLTTYLEECITIASRKRFKNLAEIHQFNDLSQETRLKITMKRWNDMDAAIEATGQINEITPTEDFYQPYRPWPVFAPAPAQGPRFGSTPRLQGPRFGSIPKSQGFQFGSTPASLGGTVTPTQPIDFINNIKPFMQNN